MQKINLINLTQDIMITSEQQSNKDGFGKQFNLFNIIYVLSKWSKQINCSNKKIRQKRK